MFPSLSSPESRAGRSAPRGSDPRGEERRERANARRAARRGAPGDRPPGAEWPPVADRPPGPGRPPHPEERRPPDLHPDRPVEGRKIEVAPVRRLLSLTVAGFAGILGIGLIFGAQTSGVGSARSPYGLVIFGVQVLFVVSWTVAIRPPAPRIVTAVGILTAAGADLAAILPVRASMAYLGYVAAAGLVAGVIGQLSRPASRVRATESLSATVVVVVGVVAFATLIVLTRVVVGTQAIVASLASTAISLVVARLLDIVAPFPRLAPQVPRGATGIVVGAMAGSAVGAFLGSYLAGLDPQKGAMVGFISALAAVLADLAVGYADAGRRLAGEPGSLWLARHMQGPLGGFALAAPATYVISVLFLVPNLSG